MSENTLEAIRADYARLGDRIAALEALAQRRAVLFPAAKIEMEPGEHYAGIILDAEGRPAHHLILLPGDAVEVTWEQAQEWAKEAGGALPTRQEQALLYANLKGQFESEWYWSDAQHASNAACAWCQDFSYGGQSNDRRYYRLRARAVRRLTIQ